MADSILPNQMAWRSSGIGAQIPFNALCEPGAFVTNWSGHLLRLPDAAVRRRRTPLMNMIGGQPLIVTKISDDPFVPISAARTSAANLGAPVDF